MTLSRRAFASAALAAPFAATAAAPVVAQAANPATARAALYSAPLGRYKITALLDGIAPLGRGVFFGSDQIDRVMQETGLGPEALPAPISSYLLQSEDRTILIDAGMGLEFAGFGPGFGRLFPGLAALGLKPEDIDTLIITHLHVDHIGGMLHGGSAVFPNAEVIIAEQEAGFWTDPAMLAAAPEEAKGFFQLAAGTVAAYGDQITLVQDGAEIAPGVSAQLAVGHTPGHMALRIDGGDRQMLMVADLLHSADIHTAVPEAGFGFDVDAAVAVETRKRLFDQLSSDKTLIAGSHIHFPGFGRILPAGEAYRFASATWS